MNKKKKNNEKEEEDKKVPIKEKITLNKAQKGSLYVFDFGTSESELVASFDLDDTIITTKSKKLFAINANDWEFLYPNTADKLKKANEKGYRIVIFTNQHGVGKGNKNISEFENKFCQIQKELDIPMIYFVATGEDEFRKPSTGMWQYFVENYSKTKTVDLAKSCYVGDAAGRSKTAYHKKDFSDSDLKFAFNVKIPFETPEEYFLGKKQTVKVSPSIDMSIVKTEGPLFEGDTQTSLSPPQKQEVVLFTGAPGSGKSTFWKNHMKSSYERINRDTLKTIPKCIKEMERILDLGKSCVIDNTNPAKTDRAQFIKIAQQKKVPIRCFFFDVPKKLSMHMDLLRVTNKFREHMSTKVGKIATNVYFSKLEPPSTSEGFSEVKKVNFIATFENEDDKKEFFKLS